LAESIFAKSNQDADDEESDQEEKLDHIASLKLLSKKRIKPKKSSAVIFHHELLHSLKLKKFQTSESSK